MPNSPSKLAANKRWRDKNREKIKAKDRADRAVRNSLNPNRKVPMTEEEKAEHRKKYNREYRLRNLDRINARRVVVKERARRLAQARHPHYRKIRIEREYGLSPEAYDTMLLKQNGVCVICERDPKTLTCKRNTIHVDHSHDTGKVRGLLCRDCNLLLGNANDNAKVLQRAIWYLNERG